MLLSLWQLQRYCESNGFSIHQPHLGSEGFYERMVHSVKAPVRMVLGRGLLWRIELETILAEIEFS